MGTDIIQVTTRETATSERGRRPPAIVELAGRPAMFAYAEFFGAQLDNEHTHRAYRHAVDRFLGWCGGRELELHQVSPALVGEYVRGLLTRGGQQASKPTRKLHLAAIRQFFDPCTSAQLAEVLGKSPKTIVDWCQERDYTLLPCFRLGNRWYHRVPELVRWLNGVKSGRIEFRRKPRISQQRR